jgi:RNA polymerase sigma-70 factor (ECF subfamily)
MTEYARGNAQAFSEVYDAVAPRLERYLRRHGRNQAHIEDIIQHTFMQMHDKRGTFKAGAQVTPWAFSIARNFMIDSWQKTRRELAMDGHDDGAAVDAFLVQAVADGEQVLEARRLGERLAEVFRGCTEHQRNAFELTRVDGLSQLEAAQILNTTVMGIKQCAHKVYEKLRAALAEPDQPRALPFSDHLPTRRSAAPAAQRSGRPPSSRW